MNCQQKRERIQTQLEENIDIKTFQRLNQQLIKFIEKYNGKINHQTNQQKIFTFVVKKDQQKKLTFFLQTRLIKSKCFKIVLQVSLKPFENQIKCIGLDIIKNRVQLFNSSAVSNFTYQYKEKGGALAIFAKLQVKNAQVIKQTIKLMEKQKQKILELFQLLISCKKSQKTARNTTILKLLPMMLQYQRTKNPNSSSIILNQSQPTEQKKQFFFQKVKDYQQQLKIKFSKSSNIFRNIKVSKEEKIDWRASYGRYAKIQKLWVKYMVDQQGSIYPETNNMIRQQKSKNETQLAQKHKYIQENECNTGQSNMTSKQQSTQILGKDKQRPQQKYIQNYLARKIPLKNSKQESLYDNELSMYDNNDDDDKVEEKDIINCFKVQMKLLATLRNLRCPSINSYYYLQKNILESHNVYSDFHENTLQNVKSTNINNFKYILLTLIEGICFLQKNGVSHRDLKPQNILVSKNYHAKLIDFGSGCHTSFFILPSNISKQNKNFQLKYKVNTYYGQVFSNIYYYQMFSKLNQQVKKRFFHMANKYYSHPLLDIMAIGKMIQQFICSMKNKAYLGEPLWQSYKNLSKSCMAQNPDDRPQPKLIYTYFKELIQYEKQL